LCRFLVAFLKADNCGAKKPGAFTTGNYENMGGVYAAGFMPFLEILGRARMPCPLPGMDAGQVVKNAYWDNAMFSLLPKPGFFVPHFSRAFYTGGKGGTKRAELMI
jgi:hypothetical protein